MKKFLYVLLAIILVILLTNLGNKKALAFNNISNLNLSKDKKLSVSNAKDVDFGPYMRELQRRIKRNWHPPKGNEREKVTVLLKLSRDGSLLSLNISKSSGSADVDKAALEAIKMSAPFRPLPSEYNGKDIDVQFTFDYNVFSVGSKVGSSVGSKKNDLNLHPSLYNVSYKYLIVDKDGKFITKTNYDQINIIDGNFIAVCIDKKWGFLDRTGKYIIKPQFSDTRNLTNELTSVLLDNKWGVIDRNGCYIIEPKFNEISNDYHYGQQQLKVKINNKWGIIDYSGNYIIKPEFDSIGAFSEGLAPVKIGDKFGYINYKGEIVIQPQFEEAESFRNLNFIVESKVKSNGKYGIINTKGEYIVKPEYDAISFINQILFSAKKDNKWGLIGLNGEIVVEPKFDEISNLYNYSANNAISVKIGNKWGIIDKSGKYLVNPISDKPIIYKNGFAVITFESKKEDSSSSSVKPKIQNKTK